MRTINRFSLILCLGALLYAVSVILLRDPVAGKAFGPAAYYYTDIPGWQSRFYSPGLPGMDSWSAWLGSFLISGLFTGILLWGLLRMDKKDTCRKMRQRPPGNRE